MKKQIISQKDYKTSNWSGGETTEVFLYPPSGDYASRRFDYRISTAQVNLAESEFTSLAGYERLLMSLNNPLELVHENDSEVRTVQLKPFEVDSFSGSDMTKSFGQCQDFNLIYLPKYEGKMTAKYLNDVTLPISGVTYIYYALNSVMIQIKQVNQTEKVQLQPGESLLIEEVTDKVELIFQTEEVTDKPIIIEVSVR